MDIFRVKASEFVVQYFLPRDHSSNLWMVLGGFHFYCKAHRYAAKCVHVQQLATRQKPRKWSHRKVIEEHCWFFLSANACFIV